MKEVAPSPASQLRPLTGVEAEIYHQARHELEEAEAQVESLSVRLENWRDLLDQRRRKLARLAKRFAP